MKILFVLSAFPFPPKIGRDIVAFNNIRILAQRHQVHLVCNSFRLNLSQDERFADFVYHAPDKTPEPMSLPLHAVSNVMRGLPTLIYQARWVTKKIREIDKIEKFDAILSYGFSTTLDCPKELRYKLIANIEDPQFLKLTRMRALPLCTSWDKIKLTILLLSMKRFEQKMFPSIGNVALLSEADIIDIQTMLHYQNLCFVPYGVERADDSLIAQKTTREDGMIIISGNMFYLPNVEGVLFFISQVFPKVLAQYPRAKLWIVGADPKPSIRTIASRFSNNVIITGRVDNVSDYLRRAMVSVCPVRLKIGVQTKILEALSSGTPVVTTTAGNSGIQAVHGRDLWIEDDPVAFANKVVKLLKGDGWEQLSNTGLNFVRTHFSWEKSANTLEKHIIVLRESNVSSNSNG
ncbi:MAG: glycosyltransferase [bacterium]